MHVVYFCLFTCFYAVNHLGTSESIRERGYFEEALTLNTSCNNHNECELYERCSNKKCRCISNDYIAKDDKCILRKGKFGDECTGHSDCKASFTHCGSDKTCQCHHGYLDVEQDCVLETDDDRCYNGNECGKSNFICENKICVCPREYYLQGTACIPEHGIIGDICTVNQNCKILFSVCNNQKCECNHRFYEQGYECVPIDGYESIIRAPRHYTDSNYKPVDYPCSDDRDCDHRMWCETYTRKCACRPGYLNIQNQCQLIHSLPPQFINYQYPASAIRNNPDSLTMPFTLVERHNGNPHGLQYGALGHPCQASTDCQLHYLYCNPSTKLCDCDLKYELEGGYCVQRINSELKGGMITSKVKSTVKTMINHGNPCRTNPDCYHEGLVCDQNSYRCICTYPYYLDGNYCVSQKSGESPTSYHPHQPPKLITSGSSSTGLVNHGNLCRRDSDCYHEGLICSQTTYRCTCAHHYYLVGNYCAPRSTGESPVPHNPYQPPIQVTGSNNVKRMVNHGNLCRTNSDCYHEGLICNLYTYRCTCAQHYQLDGNFCVSESSEYLTPHHPHQPPTRITGSNSVKRMVNHGNLCRTNSDCYHEGLICNLSTYRCTCAQHYYLDGSYCVSESSEYPTPHQPHQPPTRITGSNSVKRMVNHGNLCRTNSDCYHEGLICNLSTYRCTCAQHYYLDGNYCVSESSEYPTPHQPHQPPTRITGSNSVKRMVNHGNLCRTNSDCYHEGLICNLYTYRCTCAQHYYLDGNYCASESSEYPTPHHPHQPPTRITGSNSVKRMVNHGNPCRTNSDCYHEGLICNLYTYRCTCAQHYYLHGDYCVFQTIGSHPTIYNPTQRPSFPHPPRINPPPLRQVHIPYYQPKPYHTHPHDGYSRLREPYQMHMDFRPEQAPIFVPKISGVTSRGTDHCTTDISCTSPFTYCNKALGVCDCMTGYSKVGQNCVPVHVGKINDVCNSDSQCSYSHSHCYQQRCQCAHSFMFLNGMCKSETSYLKEQCNSFPTCETSDAKCDTGSNRCVCKDGYTRYIQSCRPDGEVYGRCSSLNTCNQQDLTCERSTARCKCKEGYIESGFICHPLTFTNNNYLS